MNRHPLRLGTALLAAQLLLWLAPNTAAAQALAAVDVDVALAIIQPGEGQAPRMYRIVTGEPTPRYLGEFTEFPENRFLAVGREHMVLAGPQGGADLMILPRRETPGGKLETIPLSPGPVRTAPLFATFGSNETHLFLMHPDRLERRRSGRSAAAPLWTIPPPDGTWTAMDANRLHLAAGTSTGQMAIYEQGSGSLLSLSPHAPGAITAMALSRQFAVAATNAGAVSFLTVPGGNELHRLHIEEATPPRHAAIQPERRHAAVSWQGTVRLYDLLGGVELGAIATEGQAAAALAFLRGQLLILEETGRLRLVPPGAEDATLEFWLE